MDLTRKRPGQESSHGPPGPTLKKHRSHYQKSLASEELQVYCVKQQDLLTGTFSNEPFH